MNLHDLKTFISHNMLELIEAQPALYADYKAYDVVAFIKTPDPKVRISLTFSTDRPFADQSEITRFFTNAGVPKHKLHFVFPSSDRYFSAENRA
ncbi:hypothetical protein J2X32_001504 [Rheinheimera pacifica]|uniref:hypothetical protein n=1 Tax=Rheinheimera pacifica TaxID=173990 RepID=UPI002856D282|nr:hypothetical protein [Rheinheimera pacifica]MDR6982886.1 hypothetical protein [Rheinheimera pacifica]